MKFLILFLLFTTSVFAQVLDDNAVNLKFSGRLNEAKGVAIASAAIANLNSVAGNLVHITGAVTITSFGIPSQAGIRRIVIFDGAPLITHSGTVLVLPGNVNFQAAAGDSMVVVSDDAVSKWIVISISKKNGSPLLDGGIRTAQVAISSSTVLLTSEVLGPIALVDAVNGAISSQLPLGASLSAASPGYQIGSSFEMTIINTGNNTHTLTANTGSSIIGLATIATATSGTYIGTFSAADTVIFYRK